MIFILVSNQENLSRSKMKFQIKENCCLYFFFFLWEIIHLYYICNSRVIENNNWNWIIHQEYTCLYRFMYFILQFWICSLKYFALFIEHSSISNVINPFYLSPRIKVSIPTTDISFREEIPSLSFFSLFKPLSISPVSFLAHHCA